MGLLRQSALALLAVAAMLLPVACSGSDSVDGDDFGAPGDPNVTIAPTEGASPTTIVRTLEDELTNAGDYSVIIEFLEISGLGAELAAGPPYTLLAPTDDAFSGLPEGAVESLRNDPVALRTFMLNHLIDGSVPQAILPNLDGQTLLTRSGANLSVLVEPDAIWLVNTGGGRIGVIPGGGLSGPSGLVIAVNQVVPVAG